MEKIKKTIALMVVLIPVLGMAQDVDYDKIILPDGVYTDLFEEKLVRLAWKNNPASHMVQDEVMSSTYDLQAVSARWTGLLGAQGNLNEFTIKKFTGGDSSTPNNLFYPRYNFSLNLPLSTFFELPKLKKSARAKVKLSKDKVNQLKLELRGRILRLYSDYRRNEQIRNLRKEALAAEDYNFILIEGKFKKGDASYDEYTRVQRSRSDLGIQVVIAESDYAKSKFDIEELIGVKLEQVK